MIGPYGGLRGKPVWAERIGKKYMWTAMYQLAPRLHDNVDIGLMTCWPSSRWPRMAPVRPSGIAVITQPIRLMALMVPPSQ